MQFQALNADLDPLSFSEALTDYMPVKKDIECSKCLGVYELWAPIFETEQAQVDAQTKWLLEYLPKVCPDHPDLFRTPDRPE